MNAAYQEIFRQLNEQREAIQHLQTENKGLLAALKGGGKSGKWPDQYKAGVVKYPGCFPFPMSLEVEMQSKSKAPFGHVLELSTGSMKFDIDDPTFMINLTSSLVKTHGTIEAEPAPIPDPGIGYFRPLAMDCCAPGSPVTNQPAYNYFCDFEWKMFLDAKQMIFTYGWLPSTLLQTWDKRGYILPVQYEVKKNDTLHFNAQPLRQVQKEGDGYNLKFQVHIYKMLPDPKKVIDAIQQAEGLEL